MRTFRRFPYLERPNFGSLKDLSKKGFPLVVVFEFSGQMFGCVKPMDFDMFLEKGRIWGG